MLARKLPLLREWKHAMIPAVPVAGVAVLVVLAGHDLGTALVLILLVAGALFVAGVPMRMFGFAALLAAGLTALLTMTSDQPHRPDHVLALGRVRRRVVVLPDAARRLGAGQRRLGRARPRREPGEVVLPARPRTTTSSSRSSARSSACIGTLLVLGLFGLLAFAMIRVIRRHPDPFVQITTGAILCWIIGQALSTSPWSSAWRR